MCFMMKKRAIDLSFAELAIAGQQAASAAIAESHAAGQSTWHVSIDGQFEKVRPDGVSETFTRDVAAVAIIGKSREKKVRRKAAA